MFWLFYTDVLPKQRRCFDLATPGLIIGSYLEAIGEGGDVGLRLSPSRQWLVLCGGTHDEEVEVTIDREEEIYYRAAAKLITDRYNRYAQAYKGRKGDHTISLMTLIDIALMYEREKGNNDTAPYDTILNKLTSEIEEALK